MKNKTDILLIDDEKVIIDSVHKIAGLENWTVNATEDASIALKKFDLDNYRLILCDIMMPIIDGFQFLTELKNRGIDTPVIMITGFSTNANAVKSLYQGAIDFIPKPFTVDEILCITKRGLKYGELIKNCQKSLDLNVPNGFLTIPPNYYRLGWTSWAYIENTGTVLIGATFFFTKTTGGIERIELLDVGKQIFQGDPCSVVKTEKECLYNIQSPISGKIIEKNEKLFEDIKLIENDPY